MDFVENRIDVNTATIQAAPFSIITILRSSPANFIRLQLLGSAPHQAVLIPDQAIVSDQSQKFVWIVGAESKVEYRKVTPGPMIDGLRVIRDGVKADEHVIVLGLQSARPGITVKAEEADPQKFVGGDSPNASASVKPAAPTK